MSIEFRAMKEIPFSELFDGRLETHGIREDISAESTSAEKRCLTDGFHYLWVYRCQDGSVERFKRFGLNDPARILATIVQMFDTDIVSEHEPRFWGFDTEEEMEADSNGSEFLYFLSP